MPGGNIKHLQKLFKQTNTRVKPRCSTSNVGGDPGYSGVADLELPAMGTGQKGRASGPPDLPSKS